MSHKREDMIALFDSFDKNSDGKVSIQELKAGIKAKFCPQITDAQAAAMFLGFDDDGDKSISKAEFLEEMCDKISRKVAFNKSFEEWDKDNSGSLSIDEVRSILRKNGIPDDKIDEMFQMCDQNSDGKVTCEEFLKLM